MFYRKDIFIYQVKYPASRIPVSLFDSAVFAKTVKLTKVGGFLPLCLSSKEKLINVLFKKISYFSLCFCSVCLCACVWVCVGGGVLTCTHEGRYLRMPEEGDGSPSAALQAVINQRRELNLDPRRSEGSWPLLC